jgi:fructose-bisphosphate aldolase class I
MASPKGLLAIDDSSLSLTKRLGARGLPTDEMTQARWRSVVHHTPGLSRWLTGVFFREEYLLAVTDCVKELTDEGLEVGATVDRGRPVLEGSVGELVSEGIDGLGVRLGQLGQLGASFAKWRMLLRTDPKRALPTERAVLANVHLGARFAKAAQTAGLLPLIQVAIETDGDFDIDECALAHERTLARLAEQLHRQEVDPSELLILTNPTTDGQASHRSRDPQTVAAMTLRTLARTLPAGLGGVGLISGNNRHIDPIAVLHAVRSLPGAVPWPMTFAFGRALHDPAMDQWDGTEGGAVSAQRALADSLSAAVGANVIAS